MMINTRILSLTAPVRRGLAVVATYIGQGLLMAHVLTLLFARAPLADAALPIAGILALMLLRAGLQWLHQWLAARTAAAVKHALRGQLYAHLLDLGPGYLERTRTGRVQSTLVDGVESLERYIGFYIPQVCIVLIGPTLIMLALATQ
jgi:ABC-type transport system involved in cytochrome bd biosynthesis fused ATPase/permease subunit